MKLDTRNLRYLSSDDWRVLTAVELGSKNHEVVPTPLIAQLSNLGGTSHNHANSSPSSASKSNKNKNKGGSRHGHAHGGGGRETAASRTASASGGGAIHTSISTLARANLIGRVKNVNYDGYRLTYGGLDYLALHGHLKSGTIYSVGPCVGCGKESDIYVCADNQGRQLILKIHRLGRISFRGVKNKRDYLRGRTSGSWMYMSRLAAQKEFLFMKALGESGEEEVGQPLTDAEGRADEGSRVETMNTSKSLLSDTQPPKIRVPRAIAQNRHMVVMELIDGVPLRSVKKVGNPPALYAHLIEDILRFAKLGMIHGDFNEFNIMVKEEGEEDDDDGNDGNDAGVGEANEGGHEQQTVELRKLRIEQPPSSSSPSLPSPSIEPHDHPPSSAALPTDQQAPHHAQNQQDNTTTTTITTNSDTSLQVNPIIIDFPQMVSMDHVDAKFYFDRDVQCIKDFFRRRFGFVSDETGPFFEDAHAQVGRGVSHRLDVAVEASGFSRKMAKELEKYMQEVGADGERGEDGSEKGDEVEDCLGSSESDSEQETHEM